MANIENKFTADGGTVSTETPSPTIVDGDTDANPMPLRPGARLQAVAAAAVAPTKGGSGPVLNPRGAD